MKLVSLEKLKQIRAASRFALERLREERLSVVAGSLTFTTVLSIVPLLTVALALFTAFPLFDQFRLNLQQYFIQSLMPDAIAKGVMSALNQFSSKAARISTVGGVFLLVTALALMMTIDRAFNTIWRVQTPRGLVQRLVAYWAAITIGPLLIGGSITMTSVLMREAEKTGWLGDLIFSLLPVLLSMVAFAILYRTLPSKPVRWADAFAGGAVAAVAFEIAKRLFGLFIAKYPSYTAVYGAFAAFPIFLLWVYLSWLITLFGAAVAATIPVLQYERWHRKHVSGDVFDDALQVLHMLVEVRRAAPGQAASVSAREIRERTRLGFAEAEALLERMVALGWVAKLEETAPRAPVAQAKAVLDPGFDRWALIVDPDLIAVADVFRQFALEAAARPDASTAIQRVGRAADAELGESVAQYFAWRDSGLQVGERAA